MSSRTYGRLLFLTVTVVAILMLAVLAAMYMAAGGLAESSNLGQLVD